MNASAGNTTGSYTPQAGGSGEQAGSILVAESDPLVRERCSLTLSQAGFEVSIARDGLEAWNVLQSRVYDLLITDKNMPYLTGLQLIRRIRLARMSVPIILVLGTIIGTPIDKLPWHDCAAIVAKPYTAGQLTSVVGEVMRGRSEHRPRSAIRPTARPFLPALPGRIRGLVSRASQSR